MRTLRRFANDRRGGLPMQMALGFGAAGIAAALLGAPLLDRVAQQYAQGGSTGLDRTVTGSVQSSARYVIRQSVLSFGPQVVCGGQTAAAKCGREAN